VGKLSQISLQSASTLPVDAPDAGTPLYWPCSDYIGSNGLKCFKNAFCWNIALCSKQVRTKRIVACNPYV